MCPGSRLRPRCDLVLCGHGFTDSLIERFGLLAQHPYLGRTRDDLQPGVRSLAVGDYLIIYRVDNADVLILRVLRGNRNLSAMF